MVFFNYSTLQVAAKIVYYGPALAGKTTNLQWIFEHSQPDSRGEMVSLATETDRTLFFDLLPLDVGTVAGFHTRIQLYTVPGQVFYNTTRKLVLKGVDGVVFVVDSQRTMFQANIDSLLNLEENLAAMGVALGDIPLTFQYNKRDLPNISTIEELNKALNPRKRPCIEATATQGDGVFETLTLIAKETLQTLQNRLEQRPRAAAGTRVDESAAPNRAEIDPQAVLRLAAAKRSSPEETPEAGSEGHEASLILIAHPKDEEIGRRFRLATHMCLEIGRSSAADVSLAEVQSVSRRHARLDHRGDVVQIEDMGSTNGTLVNGRRIEGRRPLRSGDVVQAGAVHFRFLHDEHPERAYRQAIYHLFAHDGLTDVFNKKKLDEELEREVFHAHRHERPASLVLFDVDDFRKLNELHGRLCGDRVLQHLARLVRGSLQPDQVFARVGGQEFAILLPECDPAEATALAEQLAGRIAGEEVLYGEVAPKVTCTFGVAGLAPEMQRPEDLVAAAARELSEAKKRRLTLRALVGQNLDRYCIEGSLGRGSFAEVYQARDGKLSREVAVKVILPEVAAEEGFRERFERVARRSASLDHPHILPIYDIGEQGGLPFLVMPLIKGGTLAQTLIGQPRPVQEVVMLLYQLAAALDEAHAHDVLHLDVKPRNVLLGKGGRLLLADFGLASLRGAIGGTPIYTAPEVAASESVLPASDLYSLAVIGYELLAGEPPFDAADRVATLYQHANSPVPPLAPQLEGVPPEIDRAFARALAKKPADRPQSCRAFVHSLASFAAAPLSEDTVDEEIPGSSAAESDRRTSARRQIE